ncbi:MAG: hypothetical protein M0027_19335 [Candidatus Dormibacteraeota bacterium]|jgi:hypothetical protein|nr:hypothetical protein [Candidatus Dormibacteraeota bacterium]
MIMSIAPHRVLEQPQAYPADPSRAMDLGGSPSLNLPYPSPERISPQLTAQLQYENQQVGRGLSSRRIR